MAGATIAQASSVAVPLRTGGPPTQPLEVAIALKRFFLDDAGVTAIEYGLIAALIAVGIIIALQALGSSLESNFNEVSSALDQAIT